MSLSKQEMDQYSLYEGDFLVNRVNSRELVGKAGVIPKISEPLVFESKNIRVRFDRSMIVPDYANILFLCKHVRDHFEGDAKQTCGQASISQPQIASISTPLPPMPEQHRIIAKVNTFMTLCNQLEVEIDHRSNQATSLSNATIQQVIGIN